MLTMRNVKPLFAAVLATVFGAAYASADVKEIDVQLKSTGYVKVMENTGPLAGTWSLEGITAWNGAAQVAFACTSNRPYASDSNGSGAMPAGSYVHQLSVFNQWDGSRTRSYRVQIAQPIGGNDIYARITAVTISREGVNLVDCPDPRNFQNDSAKIEASYTAEADITKFPVTKLRLARQNGYVESEGDAFISLGHCVGPNTRIEVDMQMTAYEQNDIPFGSYGESSNATNPLFELYISHSGDGVLKYSWRYSGADGNAKSMNCDKADLERRVIAFDAMTTTYTSTKLGTDPYSYTFTGDNSKFKNSTSTVPISVFGHGTRKYACQDNDFKNSNAPKMRVYSVNIYESGKLLKCFVPCLASGIPGLRDVINNTFVTGIDVSKVKYGGDILEKDDPHIDLLNTVNTQEAGKSHYLELAYSFEPTTRIELDYVILTNVTADPFLFSAYGNSNMEVWAKNSHYAYTMAGVQRYTDALGVGEVGLMRTETAYGIRRTVAMDAGTVSFATAGFTNAVQEGAIALTSTGNTKILIGNRSGLDRYMPVRIYGLKLYEDGVLVRDYVPTVTNGVPCLVNAKGGDTIYPTTHSGNSGTQSAVVNAGGTIACTDGSDEAYLEFPGTGSGLDTGYKVTPRSCIEADFSLYDTYKLAAGSANRYELLNQDSGTYVFLAAAVATHRTLYWAYCDYPASGAPSNADSGLVVSNDRRQYTFDSHSGKVAFSCGDQVLFTKDMTGTRTRTDGAARNLIIGRKNAYMRLYGLKIWEYVDDAKTLVRDFVPCVTNNVAGLYDLANDKFYPLAGGTVSGKGSKSAASFVSLPQDTQIKVDGSGTLTCFAPSAKSYEWRMDGAKIDGVTGDTLTIEWTKAKPRVRTVSVVPVYEVFGEAVKGKPAEAQVEFNDLGLMIIVR